MKRLFCLYFAILALISAGAHAHAQVNNLTRLNIVVIDEDLSPVSEATVAINDDPYKHLENPSFERQAKTSLLGLSGFQELPAGVYELKVSKDGYGTNTQIVDLRDVNALHKRHIILNRKSSICK